MDIKKALLREHSKENSLLIADFIGNDPERFEVLMQCFFDKDDQLSQRAAWVLTFCWHNHPELVLPYIKQMVDLLPTDVHPAVKRNIVRNFQTQSIPKEFHGRLLDYCFKLLMDRKEAIAIRVFSMSVIDQLSKLYPDIHQELVAYLQDEVAYGSAGFKSRARKIIKA